MVFICAASVLRAFSSSSGAQASPAPARTSPPADSSNEYPYYPVGDATPVYRAVLDLIYLDGSKRPPVIIMLDTAEGTHMGGPCPIAKCIDHSWTHKSKMDTSTVLAYARTRGKSSRLVQFGYPIPIVYISHDDVNRMDADGREVIATHPMPADLPTQRWGFWAELNRKYPDAWGVTTLSKVAFNERHTEALIQAHQWCGDSCRVHETLFLRQTNGRWRVAERIPEQVEVGNSIGRYLGPAGATPKESEIVPIDRPDVPTEATARDDVYRTVLDSLYSVNGERPKRIVVTNRFYLPPQLPAHRSTIDSALVRNFAFMATIRAPLDAISRYRVPIATLPVDSIPALRGHGLDMDQTGSFFWPAFAARYPGAWGMLGVGRIAFNSNRSRALVSTYHACGYYCLNLDTWFLTRSGNSWKIAERIPGESQPTMDVEGLRYLGADVSPVAYRPRRVQGIVTDEVTRKPLPFLDMFIRRTLMTSGKATQAGIRTDKTGHYILTDLPLNATITVSVPCRGQQRAAQLVAFLVRPGMDTTVNIPVDFTVCDTTAVVQAPPAPPAPNPLSGAQAFIGSDSARFEFPRQSASTYEWDVPMKGAGPGSAEYMWGVEWEIADSLDGNAPYLLWLIKRWTPGGPHKGSLKQLISGVRLEPMVNCTTCDGAVFEEPDTDHSKVFATVENNRLVFVVRGAEAVRRIFPRTPAFVNFTQTVRHTPLPRYGPGEVSSSQRVLVNCRNSKESADAKHRCDLKH